MPVHIGLKLAASSTGANVLKGPHTSTAKLQQWHKLASTTGEHADQQRPRGGNSKFLKLRDSHPQIPQEKAAGSGIVDVNKYTMVHAIENHIVKLIDELSAEVQKSLKNRLYTLKDVI